MATRADAESAVLTARAAFLEWQEEFQAAWDKPVQQTLDGMMLHAQPPGAIDYLKRTKPDVMDRLTQEVRYGV